MLTKKLACPSCGVHLKVADNLPRGKVLKCPKCGSGFPVSVANGASPSPMPAEPLLEVSTAAEDDDRAEDVRERRRARKRLRKKKPVPSGGNSLVLGLIVFGVLLIGAGIAVIIIYWPEKKQSETLAANEPSTTTPISGSGTGAAPGSGGRREERTRPDPGPDRPAGGAGAGPTPLDPGAAAPSQPGAPADRGPNEPPAAPSTGPGPEAPAPGPGPRDGPPRPGPGPGGEAGVGPAEEQQFAAGRRVFEANCVRCHSLGGGGGGPQGGFGGPRGGGANRGPDLSTVGRDRTHTVDWFIKLIRNPRSVKANARMPSFDGRLSQADLRALAEYLASLK